jgi:tRNA A37 methylthiotransferase MiaB
MPGLCLIEKGAVQMNLADSERMAGSLESAGYTCAEDASDADVIVYNTCSIRDKVGNRLWMSPYRDRLPIAMP